MSTIANAKVAHNYNRYNGYFFGCLPTVIMGTLSDGYIVILFYKDCFGCKSSIIRCITEPKPPRLRSQEIICLTNSFTPFQNFLERGFNQFQYMQCHQ